MPHGPAVTGLNRELSSPVKVGVATGQACSVCTLTTAASLKERKTKREFGFFQGRLPAESYFKAQAGSLVKELCISSRDHLVLQQSPEGSSEMPGMRPKQN